MRVRNKIWLSTRWTLVFGWTSPLRGMHGPFSADALKILTVVLFVRLFRSVLPQAPPLGLTKPCYIRWLGAGFFSEVPGLNMPVSINVCKRKKTWQVKRAFDGIRRTVRKGGRRAYVNCGARPLVTITQICIPL